ncbi:MAG: DNA circularization N-terminal domain-containing protein [Treponema sp.]|nr:DNA circularization N-terminal domain-containing protein [Treponema sp.]
MPRPYKEDWREAYRNEKEDIARFTSYQAPGGEPVPFVLDSFKFSGGQSVDTGEYPFFGYWSNTALNQKTQKITLNGALRGDLYIAGRNRLVEALLVQTDDAAPGYIDLPLWGRFPVVVEDYDVEEKGKENGQCTVSLSLKRAGVPLADRWEHEGAVREAADAAASSLADGAAKNFNKKLKGNFNAAAIAANFSKITGTLLAFTGRIQGIQSAVNTVTSQVTNITTLIAQGIRSPLELSQALFGAAASIVAGIAGIKNSVQETAEYFRTRDNAKNMLLNMLSAVFFSTGEETVTVNETITRKESENLFKTAALSASAALLFEMGDLSYQQALSYWDLYRRLEDTVDKNDPAVFAALEAMRIAVSRELAARSMAVELTMNIADPSPLLFLSHYLSCDDDTLRYLNRIEESFVIRGPVAYV